MLNVETFTLVLCVPIYNSMLLSQGTCFVLAVSYLCCPCIQLLKYNAKFSYKKKNKKQKKQNLGGQKGSIPQV